MRMSDWSSDVCSADLADLEQDVLHHVAAERTLELERLAAEGDVVEAPGRRAQRARVADDLLVHRVQRMGDGAATGIAGGPALARAGIGRVAVGAQHAVVDPAVRDRGGDLFLAAAQHRGGDRSEEHTSELQSLMRISYAVLRLT